MKLYIDRNGLVCKDGVCPLYARHSEGDTSVNNKKCATDYCARRHQSAAAAAVNFRSTLKFEQHCQRTPIDVTNPLSPCKILS